MKPELKKRLDEEISKMKKERKENLISQWREEIFPNEKLRIIMAMLTETNQKNKGMYYVSDISKKTGITSSSIYYLMNKLSIASIVVEEKAHGREKHYFINVVDGKNMLEYALEEMFDYVDGKRI